MTIENTNATETVESDELTTLREENEKLRQQISQQQTTQIDQQLQHQQTERQRLARADEIISKAGGQVRTVLTALGYNDADIQDFLQQVGGVDGFVQLDANGVPVMQVAGRSVSLAEGIPQLPTVQRRLNSLHSADPATRLRSQIESNQAELQRLRRMCSHNPRDSVLMARYSTLKRGTAALEQELQHLTDSASSTPLAGFADTTLLQQRDAVEQQIRETPVNINDPVTIRRMADLKRKRREILSEIQAQLGR